jgi:hypothetical protein
VSYEAKGAVVAGLAFAALRDMASAVKHLQAGTIGGRHIGSEEPLSWLGQAVRFAPLPSAYPRKALGGPIRRSHQPLTV